jgi:hypothetical protein
MGIALRDFRVNVSFLITRAIQKQDEKDHGR